MELAKRARKLEVVFESKEQEIKNVLDNSFLQAHYMYKLIKSAWGYAECNNNSCKKMQNTDE